MLIKGEVIVPLKEQQFAENACLKLVESELVRGLTSKLLDGISPNTGYFFEYKGVTETYKPYYFSKVLGASIRVEPINEAPVKIIIEKIDDDTESLPKNKTFWQRFVIAIKYLFGKERKDDECER